MEDMQTAEHTGHGLKRSDEIGKLMGALAKAQGEFPIIEKSKAVDFTHNNRRTNYNYADLAIFIESIKPILTKCDLSVLHDAKTINGGCSVTTFVGHTSGQWIESSPIIVRPSDNKPQSVGSALTFACRYSLTVTLNLAAKDQDDDAAAASGIEPQEPQKFGDDPKHLTLAASLYNKHGLHKDDRQKMNEWLVEKNHSTNPAALENTIVGMVKAIIEKRAKENEQTATDAGATGAP